MGKKHKKKKKQDKADKQPEPQAEPYKHRFGFFIIPIGIALMRTK